MNLQQKFTRFAQITLIVGGCVLLIIPSSHFPPYYKPRLMTLVAFIYAFLIQLPVLIFRIPQHAAVPEVNEKMFFRGQLQVALSISFLLGALGSLGLWGLYKVNIPYDKYVHFIFSTLGMVSGVYVLRIWNGWSLKKSALILALVMGMLGVAWEFTEYFSDRWLHFGFYGRLFDHDSLFDIFTDVLGIAAGASIVAWRQWLDNKLQNRV